MDKNKIYKQALDKWGKIPQIVMLFEEMAELQKELSKNLRGKDNIDSIAEEIADVEIMLEQMKLLYEIEEQVDRWKYSKIGRLAKRLEE